MRPGRLGPVLAGLLAGVLGVVVAVLGLFAHRQMSLLGGVELPWGLLLSLLCAFALVCAASVLTGASAAASAAGGWVVCILLAVNGRPEGDYLLAADGVGQGFLWGGLATIALAFLVALRLEPPARR
jgi:hypothetical protein